MKKNCFYTCLAMTALVALAACKKEEPQVQPAHSFEVAPGSYVYFAPANLQYQASGKIWRFAEHPYDISTTNANPTSTSSNWIDLFGWGTSGQNTGAVANMPYAKSVTESDYYPGGSYSTDLAGDYACADWGKVQISNAGGSYDWRTPTAAEWNHLLTVRLHCDSLYTLATVEKIPGLILFPDDWNFEYWSMVLKYQNKSYTDNKFDSALWSQMAEQGAVFLPASGQRLGDSLSDFKLSGCYWSSTHLGAYGAYFFGFSPKFLQPNANKGRRYGMSVRLIRPAR